MNRPSELTPAQIAKAALRRLAIAQLEPTPENYAKAYAEEAGTDVPVLMTGRARAVLERLSQRATEDGEQRTALLQAMQQGEWDQAMGLLERTSGEQSAQSRAWALLIEQMAKGLERGGRQWTLARKKDSLQRVLDSSRSDFNRLQHRLRQLVSSWDTDGETAVQSASHGEAAGTDELSDTVDPSVGAGGIQSSTELLDDHVPDGGRSFSGPGADADSAGGGTREPGVQEWMGVVQPLEATVRSALPLDVERAVALADELAAVAERLASEGVTPDLAETLSDVCERARRLLAHRHHLLDQVHRLSVELASGLADFSEDESWVRGQLARLRDELGDQPSARAVQSVSQLLAQTRSRQSELRKDRDEARQALKTLLHQMLSELGELDQHTGRFSDGMARYAETVEHAQSLESLADVVREMVAESRTVHALVHETRGRLRDEHQRAVDLETQVRSLEQELRRLSDEVATDTLTQVANRRGLMQRFEVEQARMEREGCLLSVGLLDIDNFKKLNDSLGHSAGDQALVALANKVRESLRPVDVVARFGGEEFVVLLPDTEVEEAQKALTRLQRELTASLFMHESKEVFVTFSAGVTGYRSGEALEEALERADEALYEAKRTGKNRTCLGMAAARR
jgi:diguanylate cyclase